MNKEMMKTQFVANRVQTDTERLLTHLHRGGRYAHLWTDAGHASYWFRVDQRQRRHVPKRWLNHNVYFSVHPLAQIPPQNTSGSRDRRYISSQTGYICAINALFAEFDSKDTVLPIEYAPYLPAGYRVMSFAEKHTAVKAAKEMLFYRSPQRFKARTLYKLRALPYPPSVIIDSGGGYHCVPLNTEILTQNGWKTWEQVQPGETVLGYDRECGVMAWTTLQAKIIKESDKLVHVSNGIFSAVCTPEHRWVCHVKEGHQGRRTAHNQLVATEDISRRRHKIVTSAPFTNTLKPLSITACEAAILGWIATEGSITSQVRISQSERKYANEIRSLLNGIPHTERYSHGATDIVTWNINIRWFRELWQRAEMKGSKYEADWCNFVLHISDEARYAFLDAAFKGDGTYNYTGKVIIQNPGNIAEALKLAIFLSGYTPLVGHARGRDTEFTRYGKPFATWNLSVKDVGEGAVWCPQTDLGTWVMRQDDTICITGNCYWLLRDTVPLDATNRNDVQIIQHGWVGLVGGDPGAADLRRVLRMPGTYNCKPVYGEDRPRVSFVKAAFDQVYDYSTLEEVVNDWLYARQNRRERRGKQEPTRDATIESTTAEVRARFNQEHSLVDLLRAHGYAVSFQHGAHTRLARPGRDGQQSSITVFAAHDDTPERSVHFSTNDPLYSNETVNTQTGQLRRRVYDAFAVYALLDHGGNWPAAYDAAAGQRVN